MAWVGRDVKDNLVSTPQPWSGKPVTRSGCLGPHSIWSLTLSGMEHSQLLWTTGSSASLPPKQIISS